MSVPLTVQGQTFNYPQQFDTNWGPTLTNWSTAVTNALNSLPGGGTLQLSPYPGVINFANFTNTGYLALSTNSSNQLTFQGTPLATSGGGTVNVGTQYQLGYYATAGTAISGLTLITPNRALASDSNGLPIASTATATALAFVDATSSIQTQLNSKAPSASPTLSNPTLTGTVTIPNAATSTEAVAFGQVQYTFQPAVIGADTSVQNINTTTYSPTPTTATITPTSTSSRIKITVTGNSASDPGSGNSTSITLFRSISLSTPADIAPTSRGFATIINNISTGVSISVPISITYIDSPTTIGTIVYRIYMKTDAGTATWNSAGGLNTMILEELR